jgi:hypothetical protein
MKTLFTIFVLALSSQAATIISNLPISQEAVGNNFGSTGGLIRAMGFTIGGSDVLLSGISVRTSNSLPFGVSIDLRVVADTNNGDDPWLSLPFATATAFGMGSGTIGTFDLSLNTSSTLFAGDRYWLVMSTIHDSDPDLSGSFNWLASSPGQIPTGSFASHYGGRLSSNGGSVWSNDDNLLSYALQGTVKQERVPSDVPEPASFALGLAGLSALLVCRRRKA